MSMINIAGKSKAKVLQVLFNASKQQGMGFMHADGASQMTEEQAQEITNSGRLNYDYLKGRIMKVDISGDEFDGGFLIVIMAMVRHKEQLVLLSR